MYSFLSSFLVNTDYSEIIMFSAPLFLVSMYPGIKLYDHILNYEGQPSKNWNYLLGPLVV